MLLKCANIAEDSLCMLITAENTDGKYLKYFFFSTNLIV